MRERLYGEPSVLRMHTLLSSRWHLRLANALHRQVGGCGPEPLEDSTSLMRQTRSEEALIAEPQTPQPVVSFEVVAGG